MLEHLSDLDLPLDESLEERLDGDTFVFQKKLNGDEEYRLPTCKDYFSHLFYKVQFCLSLFLLNDLKLTLGTSLVEKVVGQPIPI
jgi:hypothetical protein